MSTSAVEIALRSWLMAHDDLTELLATSLSVYRSEAPPSASPPFVVFQRQSGLPLYVLGGRWGIDATYIVKAITEGHSTIAADAIDVEIEAALGDATFTLSGGGVLYCRRVEDVDYPEQAPGGVRFNHRGGVYRIWTTP